MTTLHITGGSIASEVAKQGRVNRNPEHSFNLRHMPYAIQPFMIAPVLPGETMKNALLQSRAVTDPLVNGLIGWHLEYYVFYVKLRDLAIRDQLTDMLLTGSAVPNMANGTNNNGDPLLGHIGGDVPNYTRLCLNRVVEEYFRDEGDNPPLIGDEGNATVGLPPATIDTKDNFLQSAKLESAMPLGDDGRLPGEGDDLDANIPPEWAAHYEQYKRMRALKLTEVTFEDYLRQFGVRAPKEEREDLHRPELLRYVRDWTYPSNTVNPATGGVVSACSWSIGERLDKARFFAEPGFIFGVTVARPKVYLGRKWQNAVDMLRDPFAWLPALMADDPYTSLKRFEANEGPLGFPGAENAALRPNEAYWVDVRDLFLYGDQMVQYFEGSTDNKPNDGLDNRNKVLLPRKDMTRRYCDQSDIDKLFVRAPQKMYVRQDGVMQLTIAGTQRDHT